MLNVRAALSNLREISTLIARHFFGGTRNSAADPAPDPCPFIDTQACWTHVPIEATLPRADPAFA